MRKKNQHGKSSSGRAYRKWTPEKIRVFFDTLRATGSPSTAANEIDLARSTVFDRRHSDSNFAAAWQNAIDCYVDSLEKEVDRRAFEGVDKPIYHHGKRIDTLKEYSDLLAIFRLKALRPDIYRERFEHSGPKGEPIPVMIYLPDNKRDGE